MSSSLGSAGGGDNRLGDLGSRDGGGFGDPGLDLKALRRPVLSLSPGSEAHRSKNSPALRCFSISSRRIFSFSRSPSIFSTDVPIGNMSTYGDSGSSERKVAQHFLFPFDTLTRINSSPSPNPRHSVVASNTLSRAFNLKASAIFSMSPLKVHGGRSSGVIVGGFPRGSVALFRRLSCLILASSSPPCNSAPEPGFAHVSHPSTLSPTSPARSISFPNSFAVEPCGPHKI